MADEEKKEEAVEKKKEEEKSPPEKEGDASDKSDAPLIDFGALMKRIGLGGQFFSGACIAGVLGCILPWAFFGGIGVSVTWTTLGNFLILLFLAGIGGPFVVKAIGDKDHRKIVAFIHLGVAALCILFTIILIFQFRGLSLGSIVTLAACGGMGFGAFRLAQDEKIF